MLQYSPCFNQEKYIVSHLNWVVIDAIKAEFKCSTKYTFTTGYKLLRYVDWFDIATIKQSFVYP